MPYPVDPGDLTTIANVKAWAAVAGDGDDDLLQRLVTSVSGMVVSALGRSSLQSADRTEMRDGTDGQTLMLTHWPVTSLTSISLNGIPIPASTGSTVPGWILDPWDNSPTQGPQLVALNGCQRFCIGQRNVAVSYIAGYTTIPLAIEQAVIEIVAERYRIRSRIGVNSKSMGGQVTESYSQKDINAFVASTLRPYMQVIPL